MSEATPPIVMDPDASMSSSYSSSVTVLLGTQSRYLTFTESVIGNGYKAVLFFYSSSSPDAVQMDSDLKAVYKTTAPNLNTYKVDYDIATAMGKKYGVTESNTFVVIDGQGKALESVQGASKADLEALLK